MLYRKDFFCCFKKDSSKQATLRFTHTVLGISTRGGVRTNIADNKLKVSRL